MKKLSRLAFVALAILLAFLGFKKVKVNKQENVIN